MELTNFSFLSSRIDFQVANAARVKSATKLSTGSRMDSLKEDLGSIGVSSRLQSTQLQNFAKKTNLQNFHTFLRSQSEGIDQAREIYRRMNQLAIKVLDPTTGNAGFGNSDAQSLNKEFKELSGNLAAIVNSKVNGQRLFGGRNVDFTDAISDVDTLAQPQVLWKSISVPVEHPIRSTFFAAAYPMISSLFLSRKSTIKWIHSIRELALMARTLPQILERPA